MQTKENRSTFNDLAFRIARIAAPFALTWLARNAVYRISDGKYIDLSIPANRQPLKTPEEKRFVGFLRLVDRHIRHTLDRHGLEVEYESIAVCAGTENPALNKRKIPHHRPDIVAALTGTLPSAAPAPIFNTAQIAVFELGKTIEDNEGKAVQAKHAMRAGLENYHQFDGDGITNLFRAFNTDPDGTVLDILGESLFR